MHTKGLSFLVRGHIWSHLWIYWHCSVIHWLQITLRIVDVQLVKLVGCFQVSHAVRNPQVRWIWRPTCWEGMPSACNWCNALGSTGNFCGSMQADNYANNLDYWRDLDICDKRKSRKKYNFNLWKLNFKDKDVCEVNSTNKKCIKVIRCACILSPFSVESVLFEI